jgi:hypothetical protein
LDNSVQRQEGIHEVCRSTMDCSLLEEEEEEEEEGEEEE